MKITNQTTNTTNQITPLQSKLPPKLLLFQQIQSQQIRRNLKKNKNKKY